MTKAQDLKHADKVTSMRARLFVAAAVLSFVTADAALAQFKEASDDRKGPRRGDSVVQRWQAGIVVKAEGGPCRGLLGTAPMPRAWPEQEVNKVEEDYSPIAQVSYREVEGGVELMVLNVRFLPGGQEAKALITLEIRRTVLLPPKDTAIYQLADPRRLPRDIRPYLGSSPGIESRNPKFKSLAKQITGDRQSAWEKVEAIFDWVREKVQYKSGPLRGAMVALRDGQGNHEDLASLFIALCRAANIPARTVWVPKFCYPEFYLVDDEGTGHWFPCQVAGKREFGGISETGLILAKGDCFPAAQGRRSEKERFPAESLTGEGGDPKVQFVRKVVSP